MKTNIYKVSQGLIDKDNVNLCLHDEEEIKRLRLDLIHSREQYESLQNSISDRERRPEVISDLLREKLRLENIIHKEKLSKNELLRKFEVTSAELVETKARFKEDVEKLKTHLKHEKEKCDKISTQMQSSSQVLEAEVEVQKEHC